MAAGDDSTPLPVHHPMNISDKLDTISSRPQALESIANRLPQMWRQWHIAIRTSGTVLELPSDLYCVTGLSGSIRSGQTPSSQFQLTNRVLAHAVHHGRNGHNFVCSRYVCVGGGGVR